MIRVLNIFPIRPISYAAPRIFSASSKKFFSQSNPIKNEEMERITKLAAETNLIYLKKNIELKQKEIEKETQSKEELSKSTNQNVIKREIGNDCAQLPLKFLAFYSAGLNNQGPFWAELSRSSIDALNHVLLYFTSFVHTGPSLKYPYGVEKIKNFVVMIPALLFFFSGTQIISSSLWSVLMRYNYGLEETLEEDSSFLTILLYLVSIGIESFVVLKNINDSSSLHGIARNASLWKRIKVLQKKKDPLLEVILYENVITFTSTIIPIFVTGANENIQIQRYLAYELFNRNIPNLIGKGVDLDILSGIITIIESNSYVKKVNQPKGIPTGTDKFRFSANIIFNQEKIRKELIADLEERFDRITFERRFDEREEELNELIGDIPHKIMNEIRIQQSKIEGEIFQKYPDCEDVILEIEFEKVDEYPKENARDHLNITRIINSQFFEEEINNLVSGDFMFSEQKKKALKTQQIYPYFDSKNIQKKPDYLYTELDPYYIEENLYSDEDFRYEIVKNQLEDLSTRREEISDDSDKTDSEK